MYIGIYEISKEEKDTKGFTKVFFKAIEKDGEKIEVKDKTFADCLLGKLKTTEPTDASFVRTEVCTPAAEEINLIMLKYNIKISDFQHLVTLVQTSLQHNAVKADEVKWGISNDERTMLDIHKALTE